MANPQSVGGGSVQINLGLASQSAAGNGSSVVNWNLQLVNTGGGGSSSYYNWSFSPGASGSGGWIYATNNTIFASGQFTIWHDANGNGYADTSGYFAWYNGSGTAYQGYTPPKIYRSAGWSSSSSSNIKSTTATISNTVSDWGIGTSHGHRMYYRIQGSGSAWSQTADSNGDSNPVSWNLTGLKPGKTYEYYSAQWNNNTSAVNGSTQTFKTKSIPGMLPILMGLIS
jgi:hypothetical protein